MLVFFVSLWFLIVSAAEINWSFKLDSYPRTCVILDHIQVHKLMKKTCFLRCNIIKYSLVCYTKYRMLDTARVCSEAYENPNCLIKIKRIKIKKKGYMDLIIQLMKCLLIELTMRIRFGILVTYKGS